MADRFDQLLTVLARTRVASALQTRGVTYLVCGRGFLDDEGTPVSDRLALEQLGAHDIDAVATLITAVPGEQKFIHTGELANTRLA